ncbi:MAG: hypothetical protein WCK02_02060 [Bacteroidota bacterium]
MKKLLLIIIGISLIAGCVTKKRCGDKFPPEVRIIKTIIHDTIEKVKDTTVFVPADSSWFRALLKCDSAGNVYIAEIIDLQTGKNMNINAGIKENIITVKTKIDSSAVYIHWKETHTKTTVKSDTLKIQSAFKVRELSKFDNFIFILRWIWDIWWMVYLVGWLLWKWLKIKFSL